MIGVYGTFASVPDHQYLVCHIATQSRLPTCHGEVVDRQSLIPMPLPLMSDILHETSRVPHGNDFRLKAQYFGVTLELLWCYFGAV
jgi:hypothetical protein